MTSVGRSLVALALAPLGACAAFALNTLFVGLARPEVGLTGALWPAVLIALGTVYLYSLIVGAVLVLPILVLVPRLRNPSVVLAATWGSLAASVAGRLLMGSTWGPGILGWGRLVFFALLGATSGLVYAVVVRYRRP
jgi:hypothetical protein